MSCQSRVVLYIVTVLPFTTGTAIRGATPTDELDRLTRRRVGEARVDQRPAVPILQHPQVEVIERERQAHAQPVHAGRDAAHGAGRGRFCMREFESGHECKLG